MLDLSEEIKSMIDDSRMDETKVVSLIRDMLTSAYKRKFGTDDNVVVRFFPNDAGIENRCVELYSVKEVVNEEDWYDKVRQIPLDDAQMLVEDVEVGDSLEIPIDPRTFEYSAVQSAKQRSQQVVKEYTTDKVYIDAKAMEGKLVIGEIKRLNPRNGDYIVNLNLDGADALFPLRGQSPRETYEITEKLKFYVEKVDKVGSQNDKGRKGRDAKGRGASVNILLSRSSKEFVKALIENEVPEISTGDVEIKAIARHAGVRTKVAVDTHKTDIDPVGSTVGKAGVRIQTVMAECDGEKIDIVRYSEDPLVFIANALIPAQVRRVVTIDPATRHVVAIVDDNQQGIAIGQGGVNVKLAKILCDWNIEVKTQTQFNEMEETMEIYRNVDNLFRNDEDNKEEEEGDVDAEAAEAPVLSNDEIGIAPDDTPLTDIGISDELIKKLHDVDIWSIEEFFEYDDNELRDKGLTDEDISTVRDSVVITEDEEDREFECPICHEILPAGTAVCPKCGAEFEFE